MKIKIQNRNYEIKYTLRAMILFEKITKRKFSLDTLSDQLVFFYCLLMANNPEMTLTLDGLIDACDSDRTVLQAYQKFLQIVQESEALINAEEKQSGKKKG